MENPLQALSFALEKYPQNVDVVRVEQILIDSARQNERRPAFIKLAVPDEMVKALRGRREQGDLVLLVRIPSEIGERADSRIVLPGEVA